MPFYKQTTGGLHEANAVHARGYSLVEDMHEDHEYPVDGWVWAETQDDALTLLKQPYNGVPTSVSMAQFREELYKSAYDVDGLSLRDIVQQKVEASGMIMLDWWDTSPTVERHNEKVLLMAGALSVPDTALDAIFIGAALN